MSVWSLTSVDEASRPRASEITVARWRRGAFARLTLLIGAYFSAALGRAHGHVFRQP